MVSYAAFVDELIKISSWGGFESLVGRLPLKRLERMEAKLQRPPAKKIMEAMGIPGGLERLNKKTVDIGKARKMVLDRIGNLQLAEGISSAKARAQKDLASSLSMLEKKFKG